MQLPNANLQYSHFEQLNRLAQVTELNDANLQGARLNPSCLIGADLHGTDFTGAFLMNADLRRTTSWENTVLDAADLAGADLRGAKKLDCDQLKSAKNWKAAYRDQTLACGASIPTRLEDPLYCIGPGSK